MNTREIGFEEAPISIIEVEIENTAPLLMTARSEDSIKKMLDTQMKAGRQKSKAYDPEEFGRGCLYFYDHDGPIFGLPAIGFQKGMVDASAFLPKITKNAVRGSVRVTNGQECEHFGYLVPITTPGYHLRQDVVVNNNTPAKASVVVHRPKFDMWTANLIISFNSRELSVDQITALIQTAGHSVGIGAWRPQKGGPFGTYKLRSARFAE